MSDRALRHKTELLASLGSVEAFKLLASEAELKKGRMAEALMQRVLAGQERLEELQRQVDYDRGWIDGMMYLTKHIPAAALRKLEEKDKGKEPDEPEEDFWSERATPTG